MVYIEQLKNAVDEYVKNIDSNNILNLEIIIPDFKGCFWLITDKQMVGRIEPSKDSELCLFFSFKILSKKSKRFLSDIENKKCLDDFKYLHYQNQAEFVRKTGNNVSYIMNTVENIVNSLFPDINHDLIRIDLKRITMWYTIID